MSIPDSFLEWARDRFGSDVDKLDLTAEFDSALTSEENKTAIEEKFAALVRKTEREVVEDAKARLDQQHQEEASRRAQEEQALVEEWKQTEPRAIRLGAFRVPQDLVRMTARGITHGTMLVGPGGLGKSYMTINTVKAEGVRDFVYKNTYATPLALYRLLYENRRRLIVLDDVQGILESDKSVAILKSALWEAGGRRLVCMETTAREAQDLPTTFEFNGGIILLANAVDMKNPNVRALVSRVNFYEMKLTHAEILEIMADVIEEPYKKLTMDERHEVFERVKARVTPATRNLSLRTLVRAYDFFIYARDRLDILLAHTLVTDREAELVLALMQSGRETTDQLSTWRERTMKSRASFFRKKRELLEIMGGRAQAVAAA